MNCFPVNSFCSWLSLVFLIVRIFSLSALDIRATNQSDATLHCLPEYMEICFPSTETIFTWASGDTDAFNSDKLYWCSSYDVHDPWGTDLTCATSMYGAEYLDQPKYVDGRKMYNCNNVDVTSTAKPDLISVTNTLSPKKDSFIIGEATSYKIHCTYNSKFINVTSEIELPTVETVIVTDHGRFNVDLKVCSSLECNSYFAMPATGSETEDLYIVQVSTKGAHVYPRFRNCWGSPGPYFQYSIEIVKDYCVPPGKPLSSYTELMIWEENAEDDVRLVVPPFGFVHRDKNHDLTYIMCEIHIALEPSVGVYEQRQCHINGYKGSRQHRRLQEMAKNMTDEGSCSGGYGECEQNEGKKVLYAADEHVQNEQNDLGDQDINLGSVFYSTSSNRIQIIESNSDWRGVSKVFLSAVLFAYLEGF